MAKTALCIASYADALSIMFESFNHLYGDGLLADSVDTTMSIIVVQQMQCSVKCTISERAENDA